MGYQTSTSDFIVLQFSIASSYQIMNQGLDAQITYTSWLGTLLQMKYA